jgi:hypothetical protein
MATDEWKDRRIEELENEVAELKSENVKLRQDNADLLPEADAVAWALNEMNMALGRAKDAEVRAVGLERKLKILETRLEHELSKVPLGRPTEAQIAPVDPGPVRLTQVASPHAPMEDLLGFPKEGR